MTILVFGGAHLDRRGHIEGPVMAGASNPGRFSQDTGGAGLNAAQAMAHLGMPVELIAARGGDPAGELVARAASLSGIIDSPVSFLDHPTPSYTAILDGNGDLVIALADMGLYEAFGPKQIRRHDIRAKIALAEAIVCDANLPAPSLEALCQAARKAESPLYAIAVSPAKVKRLSTCLPYLAGLMMNIAEARALAGMDGDHNDDAPPCDFDCARKLRDLGLQAGVITRGARPAILFEMDHVLECDTIRVERVLDVTGAGDALAGTLVAKRTGGLTWSQALPYGMAAAALAVASPVAAPDTINPDNLERLAASVPPLRRVSPRN